MASHFIPKEPITREARALDLAEIRGAIQKLTDGSFLVNSQWSDKTYLVNLGTGECSCPDHQFRGVVCKHIIACRKAIETSCFRVEQH